jgi:2-haloalkanoic acid dehalogenase type II
MNRRYDAVLFDLLTALLDSWSLWDAVATGDGVGRRWRAAYLAMTYRAGRYQPYEGLVADAAEAAGMPRTLAADLASRYGEIEPWPEAVSVLRALRDAGVSLGVVTNCSDSLGHLAAGRITVPFDVVVTAERAGYYKPEPQPYRLALAELVTTHDRCLFVAGSPYDLFGAAHVGLTTWWHNRIGMTRPADAPAPAACCRTLAPLVSYVLGETSAG